jgi:hypothetical protein
MADMEDLAVKRDRGYLLRLGLMLAVGLGASAMLWQGLTGDSVGGCLAGAFLGDPPAAGSGADTGASSPR